MKRISLILLTLLAICGNAFAQAGDNSVEMADRLRADGKIWVVVAVVAVVFAGLAVNLFRIDSKLKKIEKDLHIK